MSVWEQVDLKYIKVRSVDRAIQCLDGKVGTGSERDGLPSEARDTDAQLPRLAAVT